MAEIWIVNASPLISLARIGHIQLLSALAAEVVVPEGVITEVGRGPRPLVSADLGTHRVVPIKEIHPTVAAWDLGQAVRREKVKHLGGGRPGNDDQRFACRRMGRCGSGVGP